MLLNNYWKYVKAINGNAVDNSDYIIKNLNLVNTSGNTVSELTAMIYRTSHVSGTENYRVRSNMSPFFQNISMVVGTGTTAPTSNDYALNNQIKEIYNYDTGWNAEYSVGANGGVVCTFTGKVKNTGSDPITITEVGLKKSLLHIAINGSTTSETSDTILLTRDLLESPITLQEDETATITYTVTLA